MPSAVLRTGNSMLWWPPKEVLHIIVELEKHCLFACITVIVFTFLDASSRVVQLFFKPFPIFSLLFDSVNFLGSSLPSASIRSDSPVKINMVLNSYLSCFTKKHWHKHYIRWFLLRRWHCLLFTEGWFKWNSHQKATKALFVNLYESNLRVKA